MKRVLYLGLVMYLWLYFCIAGYLLYEFDKFWFAEKPRDIMEFNRIKSKYQKHMVHLLKNKDTVLKCNFDVKTGMNVTSNATWC